MSYIGHENIVNSLKQSAKLNKISHAYLFSGPSNVGKRTLALEFAKMLNCEKTANPCQQCPSCLAISNLSHPDLYLLEKNSAIKIKEIRQLQHKIHLSSSQAKYKVIILNDASLITHEASSALLKTLEEPPKKTVLILITSNKEKIIPTISSRCQEYNFNLIPKDKIKLFLKKYNLSNQEELNILSLSMGRLGLADILAKNKNSIILRQKFLVNFNKLLNSDINSQFQYAEEISKQPQNYEKIINLWLSYFRDLLLLKLNNKDLIINQLNSKDLEIISAKYKKNKIIEIINYLQSIKQGNLNKRLVLENFFLKI